MLMTLIVQKIKNMHFRDSLLIYLLSWVFPVLQEIVMTIFIIIIISASTYDNKRLEGLFIQVNAPLYYPDVIS